MVIAPEQIEVQFIIPPTPIYVFADSDRLKQVFLNLTNNAIKATQAGGKVTVTLRFTKIRQLFASLIPVLVLHLLINNVFLTASIAWRDLAPEAVCMVVAQGLVWLLHLTIIKAHGGSIELESELNKGSTFTVRLPVTDKDDKSGLPPAALTQMTPSERRNNERIAEAERKNESAQPQPQSSFAPEPAAPNNVASIGSSSSSSSSNLAAVPTPPDAVSSSASDSLPSPSTSLLLVLLGLL
jgi:hypothetical protein